MPHRETSHPKLRIASDKNTTPSGVNPSEPEKGLSNPHIDEQARVPARAPPSIASFGQDRAGTDDTSAPARRGTDGLPNAEDDDAANRYLCSVLGSIGIPERRSPTSGQGDDSSLAGLVAAAEQQRSSGTHDRVPSLPAEGLQAQDPAPARFPAGTAVKALFGRIPESLAPTAASIEAPSLARGRRRSLPNIAALGVIGAVLVTAISLALLWPSGRDRSSASISLAAAGIGPTAAPASVFDASDSLAFDREQAWDAVSSGTHRSHYCGLRGVDVAVDVTFAPSGKVTFVTIVGDGSLPPIALHCVDQLLFGLRISAFEGEPEMVSVHLDGQTGAVALR